MTEAGYLLAGEFCFDTADSIYATHFPDMPVVPGSLIIQAFIAAVEECGLLFGQLTVRDFRFNEFTAPGCYAYHMEVFQNGIVHCALERDGVVIAAGRLQV
jgi:3-hydroxymyristoyl/3-hydroxydecanoyl-(acyl carrier protein) dehydratase